MSIILSVWGAWVMLCITSWLLGPYLSDRACSNGLTVKVPAKLRAVLSDEEFAAVVAHEIGHVHHAHAIRNLLLLCCFMPIRSERRERQEHEADDYAAGVVGADVVARALRKLSKHPAAMRRAARLEKSC